MIYYSELKQINELYHHGILGQKWGVRRYQNSDGTLTSAGKKKAAKLKIKQAELASKNKIKEAKETKKLEKKMKAIKEKENKKLLKGKKNTDITTNNDSKPKAVKDMSDQELNDIVKRLNSEKMYYQLRTDINRLNPKTVSNGKKALDYVKNIAADSGKTLAKNVLTPYIEKQLKDALGLNEKKTKTLQDIADDYKARVQIQKSKDWLNDRAASR